MIKIDKNSKLIGLKIIDFGLSCYETELERDVEKLMRCGTQNFSAPEILNFNKHYNNKIDIYSLGIIMYFMLHKSLPF